MNHKQRTTIHVFLLLYGNVLIGAAVTPAASVTSTSKPEDVKSQQPTPASITPTTPAASPATIVPPPPVLPRVVEGPPQTVATAGAPPTVPVAPQVAQGVLQQLPSAAMPVQTASTQLPVAQVSPVVPPVPAAVNVPTTVVAPTTPTTVTPPTTPARGEQNKKIAQEKARKSEMDKAGLIPGSSKRNLRAGQVAPPSVLGPVAQTAATQGAPAQQQQVKIPQVTVPGKEKTDMAKKLKRKDRGRPHLVDFNFDDAPLTDMIERFAEKQRLNVILPSLGIKEKISFRPEKLLTLPEAKKYLYMFLDYAGYTVLPGADFVVVSKTKDAQRSGLPFYVFDAFTKINPETLPNTDQFVRLIYYPSILKIDNAGDNAVTAILRDNLSSPDNLIVDPLSNAVIITDKGRIARGVLELLNELDRAGTKFMLTTLQLHNASAVAIADLLKNQILAVAQRGFEDRFSPQPSGTYFTTNL